MRRGRLDHTDDNRTKRDAFVPPTSLRRLKIAIATCRNQREAIPAARYFTATKFIYMPSSLSPAPWPAP